MFRYMDIGIDDISTTARKVSIKINNQEIARARIYCIKNDLHQEPYALLEDVHVMEEFRSLGYGTKIVQLAIQEAKNLGCYKLIGTSRHSRDKVHQFYEKLGFTHHGKEFRMNL
jgi:GNAT superfamily N-acetyltransferase